MLVVQKLRSDTWTGIIEQCREVVFLTVLPWKERRRRNRRWFISLFSRKSYGCRITLLFEKRCGKKGALKVVQ
jgi:hypothetical protein